MAVARDGGNLQYVSAALRADRGLVLAAVASNGRGLKHATAPLRADPHVVLTAMATASRVHDEFWRLYTPQAQRQALEYATEALAARETFTVLLAGMGRPIPIGGQRKMMTTRRATNQSKLGMLQRTGDAVGVKQRIAGFAGVRYGADLTALRRVAALLTEARRRESAARITTRRKHRVDR